MRPGNVHTAKLDLLTACVGKIPSEHRHVPVFARGDKAFCDGAIVEWSLDQQISFVIVVRITGPVTRKFEGLRYRIFRSGFVVAEFQYQPMHWSKPYRFVVVRRPVQPDDEHQLTLFQMKRHNNQELVANLNLPPLNVWKFYNKRASIEQLIRELKGDYGIGHIPTRQFIANEVYFHLLLLAYNCVVWLQRTWLPPHLKAVTLQRLRESLLVMPAHLTRSDHRSSLWTPNSELPKIWRAGLATIGQISP